MAAATTSEFLDALDKSGLLYAADLEEVRRRDGCGRQGRNPGGSSLPPSRQEPHLLTKFQARQLLSKRHRGFFIGGKYKILDSLGEGGIHQIPRPPAADSDRSRPPALTRPFLEQAYRHIGLSIEHIARLTGHTADQVRRALHAAGVRTTGDPALSPWAARRHPSRT